MLHIKTRPLSEIRDLVVSFCCQRYLRVAWFDAASSASAVVEGDVPDETHSHSQVL